MDNDNRTTPINPTTPVSSNNYYIHHPAVGGGAPAPKPSNKNNLLMWIIIALLVVVITLLLVFLLKDDKTSEPQPVATEVVAAQQVVTDVPAPVVEEVEKPVTRPGYDGAYTLSGKVGPARANFSLRLDNGIVSGSERYAKGSGTISISGSYTSGGHFSAEEIYEGEVCGYFDGQITIDGDNATFSGSFINSKGSQYKFNLSGTRN